MRYLDIIASSWPPRLRLRLFLATGLYRWRQPTWWRNNMYLPASSRDRGPLEEELGSIRLLKRLASFFNKCLGSLYRGFMPNEKIDGWMGAGGRSLASNVPPLELYCLCLCQRFSLRHYPQLSVSGDQYQS